MIAVVKDEYAYLNYDENRTIESYIEFHGCYKVDVTAEEVLAYAKRTIVFDDQAAGSFGRDEAGIDVQSDGETGFIYIGSHFAAACYGLDALAFAMTKAGLTTTIKNGFVILQSTSWNGTTKFGDYGLENVWRTGHRCGLVSRLVNENPSGSLTLSDGTIIYSFPGVKQPSAVRGSQMAFVGRKPLMVGGTNIQIKNFVTPFKNSSDELYLAQLGAIGAQSSGVSVKTFSGMVRFEESDSATVSAQIEKLRSFTNAFSENQFNLIELTKSTAYSQEAEMLSAVSPKDITGDNSALFRSGLLLESSLKAVLQLWNSGTIGSFVNHSIYDLVTIKDDFAGLLTKYKEIKEKLKKDMLVGTIQQLSACADYVCQYAGSHITSLLQESAASGDIRTKMVEFTKEFNQAHSAWAQNPEDAIIVNIPNEVVFSVIDSTGVFHPTLTGSEDSNALAGKLTGMTALLNSLLTSTSDYDLVFVPSNKGGYMLSKSELKTEKVWFSHGVLIRAIDSSTYSFESYATGNDVLTLKLGEEVSVNDFIVSIKSATADTITVVMNGSTRSCIGRWIAGNVVDTSVAVEAAKKLMNTIISATIDKDIHSTNADSLRRLNDGIETMNSSLSADKPTYTTGCLWWKKEHDGRGDFNSARMRYMGAKMILTNDGNYAFEHYFEHKLTGWYTNGCTSASATASADRKAIRAALGDAIVSESDPKDLWAGHATVGGILLAVGGVGVLAVGILCACGAVFPVGTIVAAAAAIFLAIAFCFFGSRYKDVDCGSTMTSIRFPSHWAKAQYDITEVLPSNQADYSKVTSAISSAASDLAFTKIEPMLRTLKKSSVREMLVMCNSADTPTSIFSVQTANAMFYVDATMVTNFKEALSDLIASDDDYKATFELFVAALGTLLDGIADEKCVYYSKEAIQGAVATASPEAFDIGLQFAVKEF